MEENDKVYVKIYDANGNLLGFKDVTDAINPQPAVATH